MAEVGKPIDRVDGRLKVTGAAKYAAEFNQSNMAYAFPVRSTIANGTITRIDAGKARESAGVLSVLTHENAERLKEINQQEIMKTGGLVVDSVLPLQDNKVGFYGQPVALVVAEIYEQARYAAALVKISYTKQTPAIDLAKEMPKAEEPQELHGEKVQLNKGQAEKIIRSSPVKIERTYHTPSEHHHPMEPHSTIAAWDGADKLNIYNSTQGVKSDQGLTAYFLRLPAENVRVICPYVGGGFGCKGGQWAHITLTAMAARAINRPVKLVITRQMMVTNVGHRPETIQNIALAADKTGKLQAIRHETQSYKSFSEYFEECGKQTKVLYAAPTKEVTYKITKLNIGAPTFMRAPGETPGTFALESAMDELAFELKIDPLRLRTINHTAIDTIEKLPFSLENIKECYTVGAERFGWTQRKLEPRSNRRGKYLVGMGMATATYPAIRSTATVKMQMFANGAVKIFSATQDIGTGTYTIMAQTAADALGVPIEKIAVEIGDSSLPPAPVSGGSTTAATITAAVLAAGEMLRENLMKLAFADGKSKLNGKTMSEIDYADAEFFIKGDRSKTDAYADILLRNDKEMIEVCASGFPQNGGGLSGPQPPPCAPDRFPAEQDTEAKKYSFHSFGAQFAEVLVDEDTGVIRVSRFTSVMDIGRVLNEKTCRSQVIGGVVYGLGQTLCEETQYDKRFANPVHRSLGDYHVPVQMDVPPINVYFIGKPDLHISPIGARGIGEIGITGVAAAVANAVFNATGKRLRDLPLTPDKLL